MTAKKLEKYGGKMPRIDENISYNIGTAAYLSMVSRTTLLKDAYNGLVRFWCNDKGRKMFEGSELIAYRNRCV